MKKHPAAAGDWAQRLRWALPQSDNAEVLCNAKFCMLET